MKILLVFLIAHTLYSQEFVIASMEGLNFEKLQLNKSESALAEADSSDSKIFDNALLEAKFSNSHESITQMLGLTSTAKENLPRLWVEIALKKIKLMGKAKPIHQRLEVLNESMVYLEKAAESDIETFSRSEKWINYAKKITNKPGSKTWHSKQIDKALIETIRSNKQKAYEWSLVILFNAARKHQFKSARLNLEIALQYSRMSQMSQYASRKKEFLKEMEIFLSRSMGRENKDLKEYPLNNFYARRASLLDVVILDVESEVQAPKLEDNVVRDTSEAVVVDSSIISALEANKESRIEWGLKTLYEARRTIGKKSSKLSYFLAKQHFLFAEKTQSAEYRSKNRDSARKLLEEAIASGNKNLDTHPENKKWASASKKRLQKEFPKPKPVVESKPKSNNTGMILPTKGLVTSLYGMRKHPIYGTWKKHKGMDIAEYGNPPVKAMANGVVTRASWFQGYGNGIEIKYDNGYTSFYAHLRDMNGPTGKTRVGTRVKQGQIVGHMGHTGIGAGDHLHLEMDYKGRLIDPVPVVSKIAGVAVRIGTEL